MQTGLVADNKWEFSMDGVLYQGTIDTSFMRIGTTDDSTIYCSGTTNDKKANLFVSIPFNRRSSGKSSFTTFGNNALFTFDTSATARSQATRSTLTGITFHIDTVADGKMKVSFSGATGSLSGTSAGDAQITGGKFSCEIGKGNLAPKKFSFRRDTALVEGFVRNAGIVTNTLILDGQFYIGDVTSWFKLLIRTGGTVKPGTYQSKDGDVSLQQYTSSYFPLYITDTLGSLAVTITSVEGDVVKGYFSGANISDLSRNNVRINNGYFTCRIRNYQPQADLAGKWKFNFDEVTFYHYTLYGGNVVTAKISRSAGRTLLTLNGESDQGESVFKMVLSSAASSLVPGIYRSTIYTNSVDSLYFRSKQKLWNGNTTYLYAVNWKDTYVRIDTIDAQRVTGAMLGNTNIFFSTGGFSSAEIQKGSFSAVF